nr:putative integron gene cassette protein [uncultured bacterium]CAS02750.1 putative integron gene cassette protein [uncultured bacterium]
MTEFEKQRNELHAFLQLVEIAHLDADVSSIRQLNPPNPDIICSVSGADRGFELTALTDPVIERKFGTGKFHYSNYRVDIADAVECITRKAHKSYSMPRVELIVHEGATPVDDLWSWDQSELDAAIQLATDNSSFSRVWLLDMSNKKTRAYVRAQAPSS